MFNFNFAILNFIVGANPTMEALMEAQEGLYSKAEVLETALLQAQKAMEEAQKAAYRATNQRDWGEALVAVWKAEKTLKGLEIQLLEFPWAEDDPVLFEAIVRLKAATA